MSKARFGYKDTLGLAALFPPKKCTIKEAVHYRCRDLSSGQLESLEYHVATIEQVISDLMERLLDKGIINETEIAQIVGLDYLGDFD